MGLSHHLRGYVRADHACEGWPVQEEMQLNGFEDEVRLNTADHGRELGCVLCDVE